VQYKTSAAQSDQDQERNSRSGPDGLFEMPASRATEQEAPAGGLPAARTYHEEQIQKAITWFTSYLRSEREGYYAIGKPLDSGLRERMDGYFETELLDRVRVLELRDRRVANPWFYPIAEKKVSGICRISPTRPR
jgi:hypothetical protein